MEQNMTFRFELFVDDLPASIDFYQRVLGFTVGEQHSDKFTPITNGDVLIGLNLRSALRADHPIQVVEGERLGRGIEIVLEVDDVNAMHAHERLLSSDHFAQMTSIYKIKAHSYGNALCIFYFRY